MIFDSVVELGLNPEVITKVIFSILSIINNLAESDHLIEALQSKSK